LARQEPADPVDDANLALAIGVGARIDLRRVAGLARLCLGREVVGDKQEILGDLLSASYGDVFELAPDGTPIGQLEVVPRTGER